MLETPKQEPIVMFLIVDKKGQCHLVYFENFVYCFLPELPLCSVFVVQKTKFVLFLIRTFVLLHAVD